MKIKQKILSVIASAFSILGMIGIMLSETMIQMLIAVITILSSLFTISVINHQKK